MFRKTGSTEHLGFIETADEAERQRKAQAEAKPATDEVVREALPETARPERG